LSKRVAYLQTDSHALSVLCGDEAIAKLPQWEGWVIRKTSPSTCAPVKSRTVRSLVACSVSVPYYSGANSVGIVFDARTRLVVGVVARRGSPDAAVLLDEMQKLYDLIEAGECKPIPLQE
jgi:hypothetical protein